MKLKQKLSAGEFATLVELEPPKGVEVAPFVEAAVRVKGAVDAVVVPEMGNAVMKISSLGGCMLLAARGIETILQASCRDRNRLALQADLLAAYALGIDNVMAVEGQPPTVGDHHKARPVYDLELDELLGAIATLQKGRDLAGVELAGAPSFTMGATVNPGALGTVKEEAAAMSQRQAAGAEFFITPPVFDLDSFGGFLKQAGPVKSRIIPNVLLLKSTGMARAISLHMKHVQMPPDLITRLRKAPDRVRECIKIAREIMAAVRAEGYAGVMVSPLGWEDKLPQVLEGIG